MNDALATGTHRTTTPLDRRQVVKDILRSIQFSLFLLVFLNVNSVFAQVTIKESVTIHPEGQDSLVTGIDSSGARRDVDPLLWGEPHVLGVPLKQWIERKEREYNLFLRSRRMQVDKPQSSIPGTLSPTTVSCGEVAAVISPGPFVSCPGQFDFQTFFTASDTFEVPDEPGIGVLLKGGTMSFPGFSSCCIGADDRLIVEINGVEVVNYDLGTSNFQLLDRFDEGIDVTSVIHTGTNTYSARAFDTHGGCQWLTPLRLVYFFGRGPVERLELAVSPQSIVTNETASLFALAFDSCDNGVTLDSTVRLTVEVLSDTVYGSFITASGDTVPSPFEHVLYTDLRDGLIRFLANGFAPPTATPVTIRANLPGTGISADVVVVVDHVPDCVELIPDRTVIAPGDTVSFTVAKRAYDGTTEPFPPEQLFLVVKTSSVSNVGRLIAADGTSNEFFLQCTPEGFKFVAAESISMDSVRVEIRAEVRECPFGSILFGPCSPQASVVIVQESELHHFAVEAEPDTIRPAGTGGDSTTTITVEATLDGVPAAGISIVLERKAQQGSGGHDHHGNRPVGSFSSNTLVTGNDGRVSVQYTASAFGGVERITARSPAAGDTSSVDVTVRVLDLGPLPQGSDHIITMHTSPEAEQKHALRNANYGTPNAVAAVRAAVLSYAQELELNDDVFLAAIDMSLPSGGLFDIEGNWSPPHNLHRRGRSIDFSHFYRDRKRAVKNVPINVDEQIIRTTNVINEDRLDFWFDFYGFDRYERPEGRIHYERR